MKRSNHRQTTSLGFAPNQHGAAPDAVDMCYVLAVCPALAMSMLHAHRFEVARDDAEGVADGVPLTDEVRTRIV